MSQFSLNSNIASLGVQRRLAENSQGVTSAYSRLSSGLRINHPSDDAAGLSIASDLKVNVRIRNQAIRNLNDGAGLLNIAEGALDQLSLVVTRIEELAEQSANGVLTSRQRSALNQEATALANEYNRIIQTTEFNTLSLFGNGATSIDIEVGEGRGGGLSLLLGNLLSRNAGSGSFTAAQTLAMPSIQYGVVAGDINGDGVNDIVSARYGNWYVATGNVDGTMQQFSTIATGLTGLFAPTLADLNGDGKLDLVAADFSGENFVSALGNGDGTFLAARSFANSFVLDSYESLSVADVNDDGIVDALLRSYTYAGIDKVQIFVGNGDGTFRIGQAVSGATLTDGAFVTDIDSDGHSDLVLTDANGGIRYYRGNSSGVFSSYSSASAGPNFFGWTMGDYNQDGKMDLLSSSPTALSVQLGNGDGTFSQRTFSSSLQMLSTRTADIDGDGFSDVYGQSASGSIVVLLGNGDGTFKAANTAAPFYANGSFVFSDASNDGVLDLISAEPTNNAVVVYSQSAYRTATLAAINLQSQSSALSALDSMKAVRKRVTLEIGQIGAFQGRILSAADNLRQLVENQQSAASRILDVDVAEDAAKLIKLNILQQASVALLAQANSQPKIVLSLLSNSE